MKKLIILAIGALLGAYAQAKPIEKSRAATIATRYFAKVSKRAKDLKLVNESRMHKVKGVGSDNAQAYYAFNATDGNGFVIVSGDDMLPEIVGYSDKGSIGADGEMSDGLAFFLSCYTKYVGQVREGKITPRKASSDDATEIVSPLIKTEWDQSYPYNMYAPVNPLEKGKYAQHFPIGCVAIATAQVMNYWQWPVAIDTKGDLLFAEHDTYDAAIDTLTGNYVKDTLDLTKLAPEPYDWENMQDKFLSHNNAEGIENYAVKAEAVGRLLRDVAYSLNMSWYGVGGASMANCGALVKYFGYSADVHDIPANAFPNGNYNDEWMGLIKTDLLKRQPIIYGGTTKSGGGHAFILDGLKANGQVSVNWGWGGKENGWFDITCLNTKMYDKNDDGNWDFSFDCDMLYNLHPNYDGVEETPTPLSTDIWFMRNSFVIKEDIEVPINNDVHYFAYKHRDQALGCQFQNTSYSYGIDFDYAYVLKAKDGSADTLTVESVMEDNGTMTIEHNCWYKNLLHTDKLFTLKDGMYEVSMLVNVKNNKGESTGFTSPVALVNPPKPFYIFKDDRQCFITTKKDGCNSIYYEYSDNEDDMYIKNFLSTADIDKLTEGDSICFVLEVDYMSTTSEGLNLDDESMRCIIAILDNATNEIVDLSGYDMTETRDLLFLAEPENRAFPFQLLTKFRDLQAGDYTLYVDYPVFDMRFTLEFTVGVDESTAIKDVNTALPVVSNRTYNILGQPVNEGYRGIVIRNGKKSL